MSSELSDLGLSGGTEFHSEHQRGMESVPSPDEKCLEALEGKLGHHRRSTYHVQTLGHSLPMIISFNPYNDLGREESLSPFHRAGD